MLDPTRIIEELNKSAVDYLVIGGVAATIYGCPEQTYDLDILYAATPENRERLLKALEAIRAQWDRPLDDSVMQRQWVMSLNTSYGDLDIFTSVAGIDNYGSAAAAAKIVEWRGMPFKTLSLEDLIASKVAAADPNPRKQSALAFLKAVQQRRSAE